MKCFLFNTTGLYAPALSCRRFGFLTLKNAFLLSLATSAAFAQNGGQDDLCRSADCKTASPYWLPKEIGNADGDIPFSISVDGEELDQSGRPADRQRLSDRNLGTVDIQVKYDGLDVNTYLNVATMPVRRSYRAGERVQFLTSTNYPAFIRRAEIRIYERGKENINNPLFILPVTVNHGADWVMPAGFIKDFSYILRVYDSKGRYDETTPFTLVRTERELSLNDGGLAVAPGTGDDHTARRNIPVRGGAVTIYGQNIPSGYIVRGFDETIPVDRARKFVVQRILPSGDHKIDVAVEKSAGHGGLHFDRAINIPDNDWFYVALADINIGKRKGDARIEEVRPGEYKSMYRNGRLAFYVKGKIKGEYLLTAAADTFEDGLDGLFRNLDKKDPRRMLRRIDPNEYYPIYGDDSLFVEDAPTQGRFYVRLERDNSHVMWGTYKTAITGTEFMRSQRTLYGGSARYVSPQTTSFGERRTDVTGYVSQPDTLSEREKFLATGGSAYFMRHQDITTGSETVVIEIRDEVTDRLVERRTLNYGEDYSFDYMQGVLLLRRPLSSTSGTKGPVRDGALGGHRVYLLTNYEYNPRLSNLKGYVYGSRVQHWLNNKIRVGATGMSETTGLADQRAGGADIQYRHSEKTRLGAEIAHSQGPGFDLWRSTDGGLSWNSRDPVDKRGALSWRLYGQGELEEITRNRLTGNVGGYYERKNAGFISLSEQIAIDQEIWGANTDIALTKRDRLHLSYDDFSDAEGQKRRDGKTSIVRDINEAWQISFGLRYADLFSPWAIRSGKSGYDGERLDGGVRLDYRWSDDRKIYVFGQGTLHRSHDIDRNDRGGIGAEAQLTDKLGVTSEISYGTRGLGGLASVNYDPSADDRYYLGYKLDPDRAFDLNRTYNLYGLDQGELVAGLKRRMNDVISTYSESNYDMFGRRRSLAQTYGVVYTPDARWSVNGGVEMGRIRDRSVDNFGRQPEDFNHYAPSFTLGFADEDTGISARTRAELRFEESTLNTRNQNSYLLASGISVKMSDDWRMLANVDAVLSDSRSSLTPFRDTDYVEASLGYAYRPLGNDRLSSLFRYSWLYDMPGNYQLLTDYYQKNVRYNKSLYAPAQRSHIVSADVSYDLLRWLTVGAKYGFRYGEVKYRDSNSRLGTDFYQNWYHSSAHLGIIRVDLQFTKRWDLLLEGRVMHMAPAKTTDFGQLIALYRHLTNNFKVGVGYNFGRFSDDLRDMKKNDRGIFVNFIGKL